MAKILSIFFLLFADFSWLQAGEKTYLHLDNTAYFLGDTIRLAAYVVDTDTKRLTEKSKVLYVEMLAAEGYIIESHTYPLKNGRCAGDFYLRPLLMSGLFEIRAYTRYMQNEGDGNYYSKVFPVFEQVKDAQYSKLSIRKREKRKKKMRREGDYTRTRIEWKGNFSYIEKESSYAIQKVECTYDMANVKPFRMTTLKLKGKPGAYFSLSVSDQQSSISYPKENVIDFITGQNPLLGKYMKQSKYEAEQGLSLYGTIGGILPKMLNCTKFKGIPNATINTVSLFADKNVPSTIVADDNGKFKLDLRGFTGDAYILMKLQQAENVEEPQFIIDYDLTPKLRLYTNDELKLGKSVVMAGKTIPIMQIDDKNQLFDVIQLDLIKEADRLYNNYSFYEPFTYSGDNLNTPSIMRSSLLAGYGIFERFFEYRVDNGMRFITLDSLYSGDDYIPESKDIDYEKNITKFSQMIIRSDEPIRAYYNFSKGKRRACYAPIYGSLWHGTTYGAGILNHDYVEGGFPSVVCCLVPDIKHEWDNYKKINNIRGCRYIKVSGFSPLLSYCQPDYTNSHPVHDHRRTLYWNPDVQLDENGEATIQFYNNGTCKQFVISGEGVSEDGKAIVVE